MIISFSYIKSYKELTLDKQQPNYEFLGHPVNAYHFVRHVASSWKIIHDNVIANGLADDMGKLKHMESQFLFFLLDRILYFQKCSKIGRRKNCRTSMMLRVEPLVLSDFSPCIRLI